MIGLGNSVASLVFEREVLTKEGENVNRGAKIRKTTA